MPTLDSVWGIDIGQCALKALKLRDVDGTLQVEALDVIEHAQVLSDPEADRVQLTRTALETFLSRNSIAGSAVAVAVSGQSGFTRFVKLPPVEKKKIPDIVRFEAEQQIPFPIGEVIWRWQDFQDADSPDVEVGIFAMKRIDIAEMLEHFDEAQLTVDVVQMAPLALFNFMTFDGQLAPDGATLLADVGANKTDLVVADGPRIWTRTIQIGGNDFTEALVKAFKLSFTKAEKLKRSAATSKYARQIFQAMRPVFADLAQEIQRSIGYYTAMRREARFKRVVGLGNGFRLPGLQKFLEQQLNVPVVRVDSYNRLTAGADVNAPVLNENVLSFAVAYGLALQGLDLSAVSTNLLPDEIVRRRLWGKKKPWFAAAAVVILATLAAPLYRAMADKSALAQGEAFNEASRVARNLSNEQREYERLRGQIPDVEKPIDEYRQLFAYRSYWPALQTVVSQGIEAAFQDQKLLNSYAAARDDATREQIRMRIRQIHPMRTNREMAFITSMRTTPVRDATVEDARSALGENVGLSVPPRSGSGYASGDSGGPKRGYLIRIEGSTPLREGRAQQTLTGLRKELKAAAEGNPLLSVLNCEFTFIGKEGAGGLPARGRSTYGYESGDYEAPDSGGAPFGGGLGRRGGGPLAAGPAQPGPLFPNEDASNDTRFIVAIVVTIDSDGLTKGNNTDSLVR